MAGTPEQPLPQPTNIATEHTFHSPEVTAYHEQYLEQKKLEEEWAEQQRRFEHELLPPDQLDQLAREEIQQAYMQLSEMYAAGDPDVFGSLSDLYFRQNTKTASYDSTRDKQGEPEELLLWTKDRSQSASAHWAYVCVVRNKSLHVSISGSSGPHVSDAVHIYAATPTTPAQIESHTKFRDHEDVKPDPNTALAHRLAGGIIKRALISLSQNKNNRR